MADALARIDPRRYLEQFLVRGVRPDGRRLGRCRAAAVACGTVSSAASSAMARLGRTTVVCGVKMEVCTPEAVAPGNGRVEVAMVPPNPSASDAVRAAVVGSGALPLGQLGIEEGKSAWVLYCDAVVVADDGNAQDAAMIAVVAALGALRLPETRTEDDGEVVVCEARPYARRLELARVPVPATFGVVGRSVLADPTGDEERLLDAAVTIVVDDAGDVCAAHKPGGAPLPADVVDACVASASARAKDLHRLIREAIEAQQTG